MRCYLFDIDGTVADLSHRLHYISEAFDDQGMKRKPDWSAFYAACHLDTPIPHIIELAKMLANFERIVFVSGRSDECMPQTQEWLTREIGHYNALYMRKAGDDRPDNIIKIELLAQLRADGYEPIMAFDDRNQVVEAWRKAGIPCAQVAEGNF